METIEKGIQLMNEGQVEQALTLLKNYALSTTDEHKFIIVELYCEWGFVDEAVHLLEELLQTYPNEGQIITKLAEIYIDLEKDDRAIHLLNRVHGEDDYYLHSLFILADLYQTQGLFEVSEQKLLQAKKVAPDEYVIDFALGELFFSIGQYSRAIPYYEKVIEHVKELNHIAITERLAESFALTGQYEEALNYYRFLSSKDPDVLFKYGFTAKQLNRNDIAIKIWKQLMQIDPYYHSVYYELANVMEKEMMMEEAYEIVKQGLSYDEHNKELYYIAGKLAVKLQDNQQGMKYLQRAIELDNDYKNAIMLLIQLYKDTNQHEEVIHLVTNVSDAGVTDPLYQWELARAYYEIELYHKALEMYKKVSIHFQHDSEFLKEYGYLLVEEGLLEEAMNVLQQYVKIEPEDEEVIAFIERLHF